MTALALYVLAGGLLAAALACHRKIGRSGPVRGRSAMSLRITTDRAIDATLRRHTTVLATQYADAIETLLPPPCPHRNRPSCPVCSARRTVQAAAKVVRETGGVQQRGENRNG